MTAESAETQAKRLKLVYWPGPPKAKHFSNHRLGNSPNNLDMTYPDDDTVLSVALRTLNCEVTIVERNRNYLMIGIPHGIKLEKKLLLESQLQELVEIPDPEPEIDQESGQESK